MLDWGLKITPGNRENSIIISIRECLQICSGIIGWCQVSYGRLGIEDYTREQREQYYYQY